jgi:large subunit ribosomal protein L9
MKLILKQSVANLGEAGEVVSVKPGYGRNYLIPQGLAYVASDANLKRIEEEQTKAAERRRRDLLEAGRRAAQVEVLALAFSERAGEDGKLFGSVTAADVVERANASGELDFELDKRSVHLDEPIKALGTYEVPVRLHADVEVSIAVEVTAEG